MIFVLDKSLNNIPRTKGNIEILVEIITKLFFSHKDKKHLAIHEITATDLLEDLEKLEPKIKNMLKLINKNVQDNLAFRKEFFHIEIAEAEDLYSEDLNKLTLNFKSLSTNFDELLNKSALICEDLIDCNIFVGLAKDKYSRYLKVCRHSIELVHGGGNRMSMVVRERIFSNDKFCLIVCDSDKSCPSCALGDTAKLVKNEINGRKFEKVKVHLIILEHVRELENLYTLDFLGVDKRTYPFDESKHRYYDFKNGLAGIKKCKHETWKKFNIDIRKIPQSTEDLQKYSNINACSETEKILNKIFSFGLSNSKTL